MKPETEYRKGEDHIRFLRGIQNSMACVIEIMMKLEEQETFSQADADEIESLLFEIHYMWTKFKMTPTMIVKKENGDK